MVRARSPVEAPQYNCISLAFASKSVRLSSCLSQTRPMAAFDIQARSEAEPGTEGPSVSGSRTGRIASPLPQMMRVE
jgi:hypothetical protein